MNNIDQTRRTLEDADQRLETAVKDALIAGVSVDDLTTALAEPLCD